MNDTAKRLAILLIWLVPAVQVHAQVAPETSAGVEILVYKKWIGAAGDEADVEAQLACEHETRYPPRYINRGKPDGWLVREIPDAGMFCTVIELERETFIADTRDCRHLLLFPDQGAECTLVNTKVVKRIDMLNRYGLVMMIAVMLGAGLAAVHRHTRP